MTETHLAKADPLANLIESATIIIDLEINHGILKRSNLVSMGMPTVIEMTEFYEAEAKKLYEVLCKTLPQATMHQLLIELLNHHQNLYRGNA